MRILLPLFSLFLLLLINNGCLKDAGEGGTSTITGKVYAYDYDAEMLNLRAQYYAPDEDVFIIYGSDTIYSDDTKTNFDGTYRFQYLRPGTYTIFAYSKNLTTRLPPVFPVKKSVQIISENQVVLVEDIEIIK